MGKQVAMGFDEVVCPSCGTRISVAEQLRGPLRAELALELRSEIERVVRTEQGDELAELKESLARLETENVGLKDTERSLRQDRLELARWVAVSRSNAGEPGD
jgi:hypothetical protein